MLYCTNNLALFSVFIPDEYMKMGKMDSPFIIVELTLKKLPDAVEDPITLSSMLLATQCMLFHRRDAWVDLELNPNLLFGH